MKKPPRSTNINLQPSKNPRKKSERTLFYSIRVVKAKSKIEAVEKVEDGIFEDFDEICDFVGTRAQLEAIFRKRKE